EGQWVRRGVGAGDRREEPRAVAPAAEAGAVAGLVVAHGSQAPVLAAATRVEGRIDVHEVEGPARQAFDRLGAVGLDHEIVVEGDPLQPTERLRPQDPHAGDGTAQSGGGGVRGRLSRWSHRTVRAGGYRARRLPA